VPTLEKQTQIEEIRDKLSSNTIAILTEFQGLSVAEMTELRTILRNAKIDYKVYKNTLVRLAAEQLGVGGIEEYLVRTTAVAISQSDDLVTPAKLIKDFSLKHQNLKMKAGILGNRVITADNVNELINLPPKEAIISMLLGGMQAPISQFLGVLQAPMRDFLTVLKAIADKKGSGETTASPVEPTPEKPNSEESIPQPLEEQESENKAEDSSDHQTSES
jgi:large subunit ribosomal protein L10